MATVQEIPGGQASSRRYGETGTYERTFAVQFDEPVESVQDVESAVGIDMLAAHPQDSESVAIGFSVTSQDDSGLSWRVGVSYGPKPIDADQEGGGGGGGGGTVILKQPTWSAGSSVTAVPCFESYVGESNSTKETICNSAGDPLEGLECEAAEFRLTLTTYHLSHTEWLSVAVQYTNAINSDTWHGSGEGSWKCQGCSAQLQSAAGGVFWEVSWEFAHRDTWNLLPWDVGFHQLVNDDGEPSGAGTKRRAIVGQDKKPIKYPVALAGGVALEAGSKPEVINTGYGARVYKKLPFAGFGQIYTPFQANT